MSYTIQELKAGVTGQACSENGGVRIIMGDMAISVCASSATKPHPPGPSATSTDTISPPSPSGPVPLEKMAAAPLPPNGSNFASPYMLKIHVAGCPCQGKFAGCPCQGGFAGCPCQGQSKMVGCPCDFNSRLFSGR